MVETLAGFLSRVGLGHLFPPLAASEQLNTLAALLCAERTSLLAVLKEVGAIQSVINPVSAIQSVLYPHDKQCSAYVATATSYGYKLTAAQMQTLYFEGGHSFERKTSARQSRCDAATGRGFRGAEGFGVSGSGSAKCAR